MTLRNHVFRTIFIFVMGLALFTVGLVSQEIIGFESRFYLFALEMWRHGPTWFPMTYQQPYPDYPVTSTFLIYEFSKLLGGMNKFTAVFPSAVASAITLTVTYLIGSLHSRRWGVSAALFLLFTATFFAEARTISLDQYVTAVTTLSFYVVYAASLKDKTANLIWLIIFFALGFAFRGPLGLVIPAGVVCVFYLFEKDYRQFWKVGIAAAILLAICSAVLLVLAKTVGGMSFLHDVLHMEVLGRMQDVNTPPFYFYFQESLGAYAVAYPLAILILIDLVPKKIESNDSAFLLKLVGWALVIMIGLSIPSDKKIRYILPAAPAFALICGYLYTAAAEQKYLFILRSMFTWVCVYFPTLCLITLILIQHRLPALVILYVPLIILFVIMQGVMVLVRKRELSVLAFATLLFVASYILVVEPVNLALNQTRPFVVQVEKSRLNAHAKLVFYHEGNDGLAIKYLANAPADVQPIFLKEARDLEQLNEPVYILAKEEDSQRIYFPVVLRGKIGREPVIIFSKNVSHPQAGS